MIDLVAEQSRERELKEILAELPSFVKPTVLPPVTEPLNLNHFDCWSPDRTGDPVADYAQGERHFSTALAYSCGADSALFIFLVLMTMRHAPVGPMERAFINAAARRVIAGTTPPTAPDEWVAVVSLSAHEAVECRANETSMSSAIELGRPGSAWHIPGIASNFLIHLLTSETGPIDLGVWQFAGAALNGSKY